MAVLTHDHTSGFSNLVDAVISIVAALPNAIAATEDYRRLEAQTDKQLSDKGLSRSDLPRLVYDRHFS
ncbi:MAG: hypothetical protein AAF503_10635 [Pseudomonadota bacterium]